jgi:Flp pilus assembly protein TadB
MSPTPTCRATLTGALDVVLAALPGAALLGLPVLLLAPGALAVLALLLVVLVPVLAVAAALALAALPFALAARLARRARRVRTVPPATAVPSAA